MIHQGHPARIVQRREDLPAGFQGTQCLIVRPHIACSDSKAAESPRFAAPVTELPEEIQTLLVPSLCVHWTTLQQHMPIEKQNVCQERRIRIAAKIHDPVKPGEVFDPAS
jgi:hypothetical protein